MDMLFKIVLSTESFKSDVFDSAGIMHREWIKQKGFATIVEQVKFQTAIECHRSSSKGPILRLTSGPDWSQRPSGGPAPDHIEDDTKM